jgi:23S rRNA (cytosine1962-C5)-methyltransferase
LLKADARKWLERACKRSERYDWIVLDPPSFASVGSDTFSAERDYQLHAQRCIELLEPGGTLLAVLNHRATTAARHTQAVRAAAVAAQRQLRTLQELQPPLDCAASGESVTKSILLTVS